MSRPLLAEHFAKSYLLYERCGRLTTHFRRSAGRGAAWLARLTGGLERAKRCANRQTPRWRPSETAKVKRSRFSMNPRSRASQALCDSANPQVGAKRRRHS
jgi:hypothetical protein